MIRSILATELYAIAYKFDIEAVIKVSPEKILGFNILLIFYMNSKSLYNCLVKWEITSEKYTIINIISPNQLCERHEIVEIKYIDESINLANLIKKSG